ncbi:MAG: HAD family hydrolase [Deltaproteobacteria bacterium]|nr:HAD family hydrolase [Deltaproteobacteria bacterium]
MAPIKAIGFDLFNTLIMAEPWGINEALARLTASLADNGIAVEQEAFKQAYRDAAVRFIREAGLDGRETHNRFWISAALGELGYTLAPDDPRISSGVEAYFSAFPDFCHPVPETHATLERLGDSYRLGLLSNFTHAPAALKLMDHLDLARFFEVILISGAIGFRKPHPLVFDRLTHSLGVDGKEILYVGDDPESDIKGALNAGIQPVWFTYARDMGSPLPPGAKADPSKIPDAHIPSVSSWGELLDVLYR